MFANTIYYLIKPFIPRSLQIIVRRAVLLQKRAYYKHLWPIDEGAKKSPEGWSGWPDGKRFALLLTHDLETEKGLKNCAILANLEAQLGFRSSFNFVAKGYSVSSELKHGLVRNGFEVGVHGLHHRGNMFSSKKKFREQASQINHYLKEWRSVGFRSPCMYHNLELISELNIEYDSSTFDTDPFEPQPDGAGTIFPFWVQNGSPRKGFVELPYTLPQDFTLFVLMKEKTLTFGKRN
jgi:hypothetical protein